jgi:diaminopimelate epimerase
LRIEFTKMQGCANDYIYIDCLGGINFDPSDLSKKMSPRHFSVGADGLVCICKSDVADAKMRMFNLDGSEGQMCGNAIRCVGKYLVDNKICTSKTLKIETLSGIKTLSDFTFDENGKVDQVTVDMGKASFSPKDIPISQDEEAIEQYMEIDGTKWKFSALSVGNPHCVVVSKSIDDLDLEKIGPKFENNPLFPKRTNTEFVEVLSNDHLKMRVWERGSGETYACGTGACASVASCIKNGLCLANSDIKVDLIGGTLTIKCDDNFNILMTGPAKKIYEGVYFYGVEN